MTLRETLHELARQRLMFPLPGEWGKGEGERKLLT